MTFPKMRRSMRKKSKRVVDPTFEMTAERRAKPKKSGWGRILLSVSSSPSTTKRDHRDSPTSKSACRVSSTRTSCLIVRLRYVLSKIMSVAQVHGRLSLLAPKPSLYCDSSNLTRMSSPNTAILRAILPLKRDWDQKLSFKNSFSSCSTFYVLRPR